MIYTPSQYKILEKRKVDKDTYILKIDSNICHLPGHFVQLSLKSLLEKNECIQWEQKLVCNGVAIDHPMPINKHEICGDFEIRTI